MSRFLRWFTAGFAVLLLVAAVTDRNLPYAIFHALAAVLALVAVQGARGRYAWVFLLVFGLVDLYQATASALDWFPEAWFQWSAADDLAHLTLGPLLLALGLAGRFFPRRTT
jgi:hypothetical protein